MIFLSMQRLQLTKYKSVTEYPSQWVLIVSLAILISVFANALSDIIYLSPLQSSASSILGLTDKMQMQHFYEYIVMFFIVVLVFFMLHLYLGFFISVKMLGSHIPYESFSRSREEYKRIIASVRSKRSFSLRSFILSLIFFLISCHQQDYSSFKPIIPGTYYFTFLSFAEILCFFTVILLLEWPFLRLANSLDDVFGDPQQTSPM